MARSRVVRGCLAAMLLLPALARAQAQVPRFRTSTQATLLDVAVLDDDGRPIPDLQATDFTVSIDGKNRRVLSADWVPLAAQARNASDGGPSVPEGYTSNQGSRGGRMIALLIDQGHITFGGTVFMRSALNAFIDRLEPSDRVAVLGLCPGGPKPVPFTTDRDAVRRALASMVGQWTVMHTASPAAPGGGRGGFSQGAPDIGANNTPTTTCGGADASGALGIFDGTEDEDAAWQEVRTMMVALQEIDGPKTLVLVSEGLARPSETSIAAEIERQAAAARATVYGLLLDRRVPDALVRGVDESAPPGGFDARDGLSAFVNATGGAVFTAAVSADRAVERIESEISGYYVVGVESDPGDRDGDDRRLSVKVKRPGAIVRARRWLNTTPNAAASQSAAERIQAAFGSFTPFSGLPLRVGTFALRQPGNTRLFVLVHAEIGENHAQPGSVTLGLTITDREGRLVGAKSGISSLAPVLRDAPSPLELTTSVLLPQGDYLLKLAVVEGERIGSVERALHVGFGGTGAVRLSDFVVGGAAGASASPRPAVASTVRSGFVQGYLEAYGPGVGALRAVYDVLRAGSDQPLSTLALPAASADGKAVFSGVVDVHDLPPGSYTLRATVSAAAGIVDRITTGFEIPLNPAAAPSSGSR